MARVDHAKNTPAFLKAKVKHRETRRQKPGVSNFPFPKAVALKVVATPALLDWDAGNTRLGERGRTST